MLWREQTRGATGSGNCSQDTERNQKGTTLGWFSYHAVSTFISRQFWDRLLVNCIYFDDNQKTIFLFHYSPALNIAGICDKITFSVFAQNSTAATGAQETPQDQDSGSEPQSQTEGTI